MIVMQCNYQKPSLTSIHVFHVSDRTHPPTRVVAIIIDIGPREQASRNSNSTTTNPSHSYRQTVCRNGRMKQFTIPPGQVGRYLDK